jgi:hypothetical protein
LTLALIFGSVSLTGTGMTNMFVRLGRNPWSPDLARAAWSGLAELAIPASSRSPC